MIFGPLINGHASPALDCNVSVSFPPAELRAINPVAHVSPAEQGHSSASEGTF